MSSRDAIVGTLLPFLQQKIADLTKQLDDARVSLKEMPSIETETRVGRIWMERFKAEKQSKELSDSGAAAEKETLKELLIEKKEGLDEELKLAAVVPENFARIGRIFNRLEEVGEHLKFVMALEDDESSSPTTLPATSLAVRTTPAPLSPASKMDIEATNMAPSTGHAKGKEIECDALDNIETGINPSNAASKVPVKFNNVSKKRRGSSVGLEKLPYTHVFDLRLENETIVVETNCYICDANCKSNGEFFQGLNGYMNHARTHESEKSLKKDELIQRAKDHCALRRVVPSDIARRDNGEALLHVFPRHYGTDDKDVADSATHSSYSNGSGTGESDSMTYSEAGRPVRNNRTSINYRALQMCAAFSENGSDEGEDRTGKRHKRSYAVARTYG